MLALRVAKGVRTHFIERLPEWCLAIHLGLVGAQLVRSDQLFKVSVAYRWGATALGISLFWLVALILNGTFAWFARSSRWVRSLSAFAVSGFWSASAYGMYEAAPASPAFINNAGYAVAAIIVSLATAHEVGASDKRAKNSCVTGNH